MIWNLHKSLERQGHIGLTPRPYSKLCRQIWAWNNGRGIRRALTSYSLMGLVIFYGSRQKHPNLSNYKILLEYNKILTNPWKVIVFSHWFDSQRAFIWKVIADVDNLILNHIYSFVGSIVLTFNCEKFIFMIFNFLYRIRIWWMRNHFKIFISSWWINLVLTYEWGLEYMPCVCHRCIWRPTHTNSNPENYIKLYQLKRNTSSGELRSIKYLFIALSQALSAPK